MRRLTVALWFSISAFAACTPRAGYHYCATLTQHHGQNGSSASSNFPVGVIGTANGSSGTGAFSSSNVNLRTAANGGAIQNTVAIGGLLSGLYKSGGTITGSVGQTCTLSAFNNGNTGGTATVALSGTNTIALNTPVVITAPGTATTSDPNTATLGSGSATCSGTATVDVIFATFVNPADLIFTSDSLGTTPLKFEIASYSASTGAIEVYTNLSISNSVDTTFYVSYGNTSQTTSPEQITQTWDSTFVFVSHMSSVALSLGSVLQVLDSTLNDNYPANSGSDFTQGTGVAGDSLAAHTNNSHLNVNSTVNFPVGSAPRTLEFWINTSNSPCPNGINEIGGFGSGNHEDEYWGFYCSDNTYSTRNTMVLELFADDGVPSTNFPQDSNWHHVVAAYPSGQTQVQFGLMYLDGASLTPTFTHPTNTLDTGGGSQGSLCIGCNPNAGTAIATFNYDEFRISNVSRSADWILATYNNFNTPGSFVTTSNATAIGQIRHQVIQQ